MSRWDLARIPAVTGGAGARARVGQLARSAAAGSKQVLLVADPGLGATGLVGEIEASLRDAGLDVETFAAFSADPTIAAADAAAAQARAIAAAVVVTVGGGSALDLGKAVAAIAPADESAIAYQLCERDFPAGPLACICVPTTSGTGSEATRTAILTRADKAKVWLWGDAVKPHDVVLDPETTVTLPPHLTAQTGIDALVHALEAATNANANAANNVYAHEAIRLATANLERAVADGTDLAAREGLQRAAFLAGIAIDNGGTAVAHNIGHALASIRPIQHGRSVALGMIATFGWNIQDDDGRFEAAARAMGLAGTRELPDAFERLARQVGIKVSLAEEFAGVTPEALAAQMARPENEAMRRSNRRRIDDADLLDFARRVLTQA